ncbi:MAG: glycosyl hydrolase [Cyanobium sp.]
MKPLGSFLMVAASATASALLMMLGHNPFPSPAAPLVGLYEYVNSPSQKAKFTLEPIFLDWNDTEAVGGLQDFLRRAQQQQRLPLITLEPFPDRAQGRNNADLLGDVLAGRHDKALKEISRVLAAYPGVVLLRFAHEMDKQDQYPWAFRDPRRYRTLYRYVYGTISAQKPSNIRWVWSPAGSPQADRYWPGDNFVDLIGLSIYSSRAWAPDHSLESFKQQVEQKRWLHRRFGRTLLVAEAGVSGSAKDQQRWLQDAIASLPHFPEVCGLVYFHAPQPRWMPLPTGHEDWSLKPDGLSWLINALPLPARQGHTCKEI